MHSLAAAGDIYRDLAENYDEAREFELTGDMEIPRDDEDARSESALRSVTTALFTHKARADAPWANLCAGSVANMTYSVRADSSRSSANRTVDFPCACAIRTGNNPCSAAGRTTGGWIDTGSATIGARDSTRSAAIGAKPCSDDTVFLAVAATVARPIVTASCFRNASSIADRANAGSIANKTAVDSRAEATIARDRSAAGASAVGASEIAQAVASSTTHFPCAEAVRAIASQPFVTGSLTPPAVDNACSLAIRACV